MTLDRLYCLLPVSFSLNRMAKWGEGAFLVLNRSAFEAVLKFSKVGKLGMEDGTAVNVSREVMRSEKYR